MIPLSLSDLEDLLHNLDEVCLEIEINGEYGLLGSIDKIRYCQSVLKTAMRVFEDEIDCMYTEYNKQRVGDEQE